MSDIHQMPYVSHRYPGFYGRFLICKTARSRVKNALSNPSQKNVWLIWTPSSCLEGVPNMYGSKYWFYSVIHHCFIIEASVLMLESQLTWSYHFFPCLNHHVWWLNPQLLGKKHPSSRWTHDIFTMEKNSQNFTARPPAPESWSSWKAKAVDNGSKSITCGKTSRELEVSVSSWGYPSHFIPRFERWDFPWNKEKQFLETPGKWLNRCKIQSEVIVICPNIWCDYYEYSQVIPSPVHTKHPLRNHDLVWNFHKIGTI